MLLGKNGELRKHIQDQANVRIVDRGAKVVIMGEAEMTQVVARLLDEMLVAVRGGHVPTLDDLSYVFSEMQTKGAGGNGGEKLGQLLAETPAIIRKDLHIRPRTSGQSTYLESIRTHEMTVVIGPAGTGKTYLAMAAAVSALLSKQVKRLVLTRPAVEAGEKLGFLPGDLVQKVDPYLRPVYDALYSMVDFDRAQRMIDRQQIEVAPLAFMRGRTLDQAFIVLDEAQNTTTEQMMMFLTRLGQGSRAVITGDITQVDLPKGMKSGLVEASHILRRVSGIEIVNLSKHDVVRNPLVQKIIDAYEEDKKSTEEPGTV
jgi:phosphate starvation-inducible PhoH-like protein